MQAHNYIEAMKKILFTLVLALITLVSCDDVSKADKLRLENKFEEAAELYQKAADEGNAYAKWRLSEAYANGDGVDFDDQEALRLLKEAAEEGCEEAQCDLAFAYMFDWYGVGQDEEKGNKMMESLVKKSNNVYVLCRYAGLLFFGEGGYEENKSKAVSILGKINDKGDARYLWTMALVYANGTDEIEIDENEYVEYIKKAYDKEPRLVAEDMARIYHYGYGDTKQDLNKMVECYQEGIKANSVICMTDLAEIYLSKDSISKDFHNPRKAVELYKKATKHGSGKAYAYLGNLYYFGEEIIKDDEKAFECWTKAVELRSPEGMFSLGFAYLEGRGCEKDIKKGIETWKSAVDYGSGAAANNLYCYYYTGDFGGKKNIELAKKYLIKAAQLNDEVACRNIAQHYYNGSDLVEKDQGQSFIYAKKAADLGDVDACSLLAYFYKNGIGCIKNPQKAKEYEDKTKAKEESENKKE